MDIIEITVIDKDEEIQQLLMDMKKLYIKMIVQKLITIIGLSLLVIVINILWEENLYGWKTLKKFIVSYDVHVRESYHHARALRHLVFIVNSSMIITMIIEKFL